MDNASIQDAYDKREGEKLSSVRKQLLKKNIEIKFATTYAPILNPMELVFCLLTANGEK